MTEIVTSIRVDKDLWTAFKIYCVQNDLKMSAVIEKLIRRELDK